MSYERYRNYRLAPDDQGCWDVLDKDYQQKLTFPSKAAAKRYIDEQTEHDENDLGQPLYPASMPQTTPSSTTELKPTCKFGHPLVGENLRVTRKWRKPREGRKGFWQEERVCKECHRLNSKVSYFRRNHPEYYRQVTRQDFRPKKVSSNGAKYA